nr:transmembrane prediction [Roseimaritima ulvae]
MTGSIRKHDESRPKPIRDRLWWVVSAPSLWALHFLACYITAAIWCEKASHPEQMSFLYALITGYSVVALVGIAAVGWLSYRNFRRGDPPLPYDFDDPQDRTHFIGFTTFLLAALSGIATLFTVLVFVLVGTCD